jgi:chitinase
MTPIIFSARVYYLFKALLFVIKNKFTHKIGIQYFIFWLFIWVNAISKYGKITANDFDLDSVPNNYDIRKILPDNYREEADEKIPANKINAQFKATSTQLKKIIEIKLQA